jgi:hypothetical protein
MQASARHGLLSEGATQKIVNEARKQADFLVVLALNINNQLLLESDYIWESLELLE